MALTLQVTPRGTPRVVPVRARSARVRALAAGLSGRAAEPNPGTGLSFGGILRGAAKIGVGFVTGGPTGAIAAGAGLVRGPRGRDVAIPPPQIVARTPDCSPGFRKDAAGRCVRTGGIIGFGERMVGIDVPFGGAPSPAGTGRATVGAFGLPAMEPAVVGNITRNDGSTGPILRCGRRMVLGSDNLCYPKAILSRRSNFRKWKLPARPPVTGGDMQAIRRAARTRDRVKDLAGDVGFTCFPKGGAKRKKKK